MQQRSPDDALTRPTWLQRLSTRQIIGLLVVGAALSSACLFTPRYWIWRAVGVPLNELISVQPELHRALYALLQLQDPWQRIDDVTNRVIEWRLFWPIIGHYIGMPRAIYLALPHVGCLLALWAAAQFAWRTTQDVVPTACATLLMATSSWFFVSTGWLAYFDSWLVLALLLASFARPRWVLFAAALFTPWIDERFILALPLCIAIRTLGSPGEPDGVRSALLRDGAALVVGVTPYLAVRLGAEVLHVRETSTNYWAGRPLLPAPLIVIFWGLWNGLRLGWVFVILAVLAARRDKRYWIIVATLGTVAVNLCVADDLSRSVSVAAPALLLGVLLAWQEQLAHMRRLLPVMAIGNLLLPAQHVIAAPANVEEPYHFVQILYVFAEWERSRDPPYFASPFAYNRRGLDYFQAGNEARALAAFEIALRFDPEFSRAHANRALLRIRSGQRAEGVAELDAALGRSPTLYDARLARAGLRLQAGDITGALEDARATLHYMPADWSRRKEAEQLEQSITTQLASRR